MSSPFLFISFFIQPLIFHFNNETSDLLQISELKDSFAFGGRHSSVFLEMFKRLPFYHVTFSFYAFYTSNFSALKDIHSGT